MIKNKPKSKSKARLETSKDGYPFDPTSDYWILNKDVSISFQNEILSIDKNTLYGLKKSLSRYASELSAKHTLNMYHRFQRMIRDTNHTTISTNTILNWRSMLDSTNEWYLGSLRGFLISWHEFGYDGISEEVVNLLESMTLKCNPRGVSVRNRCPYTGALTQNEQISFYNEVNRLFAKDMISLTSFTYVSILQATARRTVQVRQLQYQDLIKEKDIKADTFNYYLNIPRSKQRSGSFRKEFKKLAITEELYLTILNLLIRSEEKLKIDYKIILTNEERQKLPLFIDWNSIQKLCKGNSNNIGKEITHCSTSQLNIALKKVAELQVAISERTGDIIQISARRFRRTRGTNLGRQGVGAHIIAEALDHSDTQSAGIYIENTADTVAYIDEAVGKELAPFALAFKGKIIKSLSESERGSDPRARIPNSENEEIGACGTHDFCVKGYESCYLCEKFRPLLDAPHEKFLTSLYNEKSLRMKATNSVEYASTKDTLILAVEWVVQECKRIRES